LTNSATVVVEIGIEEASHRRIGVIVVFGEEFIVKHRNCGGGWAALVLFVNKE
jgi:hypothetical protein